MSTLKWDAFSPSKRRKFEAVMKFEVPPNSRNGKINSVSFDAAPVAEDQESKVVRLPFRQRQKMKQRSNILGSSKKSNHIYAG